MKRIILSCLILTLYTTCFAQKKDVFGMYWDINVPTNGGYLTKTSFAGMKFEYRHFFNDKLSAGLATNWDSYSQYFNRQTYVKQDGNYAVTSDFVAHVYTLPITATAHHYFARKGSFRPYAGVALGAQYMEQQLYYNVYTSSENNWGFVGRPEIGVFIGPPHMGMGFVLGLSYSYATNKNGITNKDSFQNFGISVGMAFQ